MKPKASGARQLSVPAVPASLGAIHDLVEQVWSGTAGVTAADRLRFETAVVEVAGNIIEHATPAGGAAEVTLSLAVGTDRASIRGVFVDDGQEADVDLDEVRMPDPGAEAGRGLALVVSLCDRVHYERAGSTNRWTLVCHRSPPHSDDGGVMFPVGLTHRPTDLRQGRCGRNRAAPGSAWGLGSGGLIA